MAGAQYQPQPLRSPGSGRHVRLLLCAIAATLTQTAFAAEPTADPVDGSVQPAAPPASAPAASAPVILPPSAETPATPPAVEAPAVAPRNATSSNGPFGRTTAPASPHNLPDSHAFNPLAGHVETPVWFGYSSPVRASVFGGETYAEPDSFLSVELVKPLKSWRFTGGSEQFQYLDARAGMAYSGGMLFNLGFGRRHYFAPENQIADFGVWYDLDNTGSGTFHQVSAGGKWQSSRYSARAHYHFPVFEVDRISRFVDLPEEPVFAGNTIALPRLRIDERAFQGVDAEIGRTFDRYVPLEVFLGGYYFFHANGDEITGGNSTIRYSFDNGVSFSLQGSYDDDMGFAMMAGISYDFVNRRPARRTLRDRMGEPVRRNRHILRRETATQVTTAALDANGDMFNVIHVSGAGNSNGTFESPYATLAEAAVDAAATPGSIIFVHADSVLTGQSIVLPENTRLLGEGVTHTVDTLTLGTVDIPRATAGLSRPLIENSPGTAPTITLANNVEVNGFRIENAGATAIFGSGLDQQIDVLNINVDGAATGIHLSNHSGTANLTDISLLNTTGSGIHIEQLQATGVVNFAGSMSVDGAGQHGIHIDRGDDGSNVTLAAAATLSVSNTTAHGIFFDDNSQNAGATFTGNTTISNTGGDGLVVSNLATGTGGTAQSIDFAGDLSITNTTGSAISSVANASDLSFQTLNLTDWNTSAINIATSTGEITFGQSLNLVNSQGSLSSTINIRNSTGPISFADVTIDDTARAASGAAAVNLFENDTGVDDFTFASLNITTDNGVALMGQDTGTGTTKLVINGGTISTTGGSSAIMLDRLATDITFQSVSVANTAIGISLQDLGAATAFHERFQIVGDSTTAGSGGVISNVQTGVLVNGSENVSLHLMNIDATTTGVRVSSNGFNDPEALTLNQLNLTDGGGTANWIGVDINWSGGAHLDDMNLISNSTFTGTGSDQIGIRIVNVQSNPAVDFTIGGNTMNLTGPSSVGIDLNVTGFAGSTSNLGGINLSPSTNNVINATDSTLRTSESDDASVTGQILINGLLFP